MDSETSRVSRKTLANQMFPRKNSKLILMPWEKRHQHTLSSFIGNNSKHKNLSGNEHLKDYLHKKTTLSDNGIDQTFVEHDGYKHLDKCLRSSTEDEHLTEENSIPKVIVRIADEQAMGTVMLPSGTHEGLASEESTCSMLKERDTCSTGNVKVSGNAAISIADKMCNSIFMDSGIEEAAEQGACDVCCRVSKDDFDAVLNKAFVSSDKYCLDEIFEYDNGEDKHLLWQTLDRLSSKIINSTEPN